MNFHIVKTIFYKELKDTLRDSKTLIVMVLLPLVLYPILSIGTGQVIITQGKKIQENIARIAVNNTDNELAKYLGKQEKVTIIESKHPKEDLKESKISGYLELPPDFDKNIIDGKNFNFTFYFDQANIESIYAQNTIFDLIKKYKSNLIEKRIVSRGVPKELLKPFEVTAENVASKEKIGGFFLGNILPFIIIFMTILGAFYPAIDQTAGEKERGTLETLLTTPVNKHDIITGKFLTVSLFAFLTGLLNLGSMTFSITILLSSDKINFSIPITSMLLIFLLLIPTTMFFVAIMMVVSSLANSFKDAQNYLTPVYMVCGFPAMVTIFPWFSLNLKSAMIPVANVSLLIKDILLGKVELDMIIMVLCVMIIYSTISIAIAGKLFNREDVLLSDESNLKLLFSGEISTKDKKPNFLEAITLYIITFSMLFYLGNPIQTQYKLNGVLITEIFLVFLPAILFAKYLKYDYKETFSLKKVSLNSLLGSGMLAISGSFFVLKFVSVIQDQFLKMPDEMKKAFEDFLKDNTSDTSFIKIFLVVAVSAAICEETLFRGPLMAGIKSKFGKLETVVIVGTLFGLFHLNLYKLIPTSVLGMLITYVALSTGSIFNGMFFHLINNGTAIILSGSLWLKEDAEWFYYPIMLIVFIIGLFLLNFSPKENTGNL